MENMKSILMLGCKGLKQFLLMISFNVQFCSNNNMQKYCLWVSIDYFNKMSFKLPLYTFSRVQPEKNVAKS